MRHRGSSLAMLLASVGIASSATASPANSKTPKVAIIKSTPKGAKRGITDQGQSRFVEMFVAGVLPTDGGPAVVLHDEGEQNLLPIWIGSSEAHAIQLRLERRRFPRPLTHDLLDAIMHDLGGTILKIHVDDMRGETFVGTVFVRKGAKVSHFDARASDSIALAVGSRAPIFVSRSVLRRMSMSRKDMHREPRRTKPADTVTPKTTSRSIAQSL